MYKIYIYGNRYKYNRIEKKKKNRKLQINYK